MANYPRWRVLRVRGMCLVSRSFLATHSFSVLRRTLLVFRIGARLRPPLVPFGGPILPPPSYCRYAAAPDPGGVLVPSMDPDDCVVRNVDLKVGRASSQGRLQLWNPPNGSLPPLPHLLLVFALAESPPFSESSWSEACGSWCGGQTVRASRPCSRL